MYLLPRLRTAFDIRTWAPWTILLNHNCTWMTQTKKSGYLFVLFSFAPHRLNDETQDCVHALTEKSKAGNEMVANLVQSLGSALVYPDAGNFDTNRKLWDNYAAEWEPNARFCVSLKRWKIAYGVDFNTWCTS